MHQAKIDGKWYIVTEESRDHVLILLNDEKPFIVPKKNIQAEK